MSGDAHDHTCGAQPRLRTPTVKDAAAIWRLLPTVGNLERNSCYAYLLLCSHFADTCLLAEHDGHLLGFVLAYRPPSEPDALFVWQVGVVPAVRGTGLGGRMLTALLQLPATAGARFLTATVCADNGPSLAMFHRLARSLGVSCEQGAGFLGSLFALPHPDEDTLRIGPLKGDT